jgi:hypothetical protein
MTSRSNKPSRSRLSLLTASIAGFTALAAAGCGTAGLPWRDPGRRGGAVVTRGPSVKAIIAGPALIHAYSEFPGGTIYRARAATGTDADCGLPEGASVTPAATRLGADRVTSFEVAQGQVACLATSTKRSFELLWHAMKVPNGPVLQARK